MSTPTPANDGGGSRIYNSTLKRKTPLKRSQKPIARSAVPIKRKKRIAPMSAKREADNAIYKIRRPIFLDKRSVCEAPTLLAVPPAEEMTPEIEVFIERIKTECTYHSTEVHHLWSGKDRDAHFLDEDTWMPGCCGCHRIITNHPKEARACGLLY